MSDPANRLAQLHMISIGTHKIHVFEIVACGVGKDEMNGVTREFRPRYSAFPIRVDIVGDSKGTLLVGEPKPVQLPLGIGLPGADTRIADRLAGKDGPPTFEISASFAT